MRNKNFITSPHKGEGDIKRDEFVTIIILGDNHGYRMKSYGPLPLISIHNKTLIERQVEAIEDIFTRFEIILCTGFESTKTVQFIKDKLSDVNIRTVENQIHYNSNCCESARLCINNTSNSRILICGGGVLLRPSQLDIINYGKSTVVIQNQVDDSNFEIGVVENNHKLERFAVGIKHKYWTEIVYLHSKDYVDTFSSIVSNTEYKNRFVFEAINNLSKKMDIKVQENTTSKPIIKIDNIKTLRKIMRI